MRHRPPREEPKQWAGNGDGKAGLHGDGHLADSRPPVRASMLESERWAGSLLLGRPGIFPGTSPSVVWPRAECPTVPLPFPSLPHPPPPPSARLGLSY